MFILLLFSRSFNPKWCTCVVGHGKQSQSPGVTRAILHRVIQDNYGFTVCRIDGTPKIKRVTRTHLWHLSSSVAPGTQKNHGEGSGDAERGVQNIALLVLLGDLLEQRQGEVGIGYRHGCHCNWWERKAGRTWKEKWNVSVKQTRQWMGRNYPSNADVTFEKKYANPHPPPTTKKAAS